MLSNVGLVTKGTAVSRGTIDALFDKDEAWDVHAVQVNIQFGTEHVSANRHPLQGGGAEAPLPEGGNSS